MCLRKPVQCIIPPHMLKNIAEKGKPGQSDKALMTLVSTEQLRGRRTGLTNVAAMFPAAATGRGKYRVVYSANNGMSLPGMPIRKEGESPVADHAANEAYEGSGHTYDLFHQVYGRNSIDGKGSILDSTVHYQDSYDNAFWDGQQMVYGDGDEDLPVGDRIFNRFTTSVDVIGHELTHGVIQNGSRLMYWGQSGALNESFADVFGILVRQYRDRQPARTSDWLIGAGIFTGNIRAKGLRSMIEPGNAYEDPMLGRDPQPGHMSAFVNTTTDNAGVHINSGIPNRAFCLAALELGGYAWEKAGRVWYEAMDGRLAEVATFQEAADMTIMISGEMFGSGSLEQQAIRNGWKAVGIYYSGKAPKPAAPKSGGCLGTFLSFAAIVRGNR